MRERQRESERERERKRESLFIVHLCDDVFQVNKGVTLVDLLSFCNELEAQADQLVNPVQVNKSQSIPLITQSDESNPILFCQIRVKHSHIVRCM